ISASGALNQTALGKSRSTFRKARRQRNDVLMRNDGGRSSATPNERPRMIRLRRSSRSSPLHHASLSPSSLRGKAVSRHLTRNDGVGRAEELGSSGPRAGRLHHLFGIARRIKSPRQSGFATPSRYARSDSTEEFTRRLL